MTFGTQGVMSGKTGTFFSRMPSHKLLAFLALRRHGHDEIEHHGLLFQNRRQQLRVLILLDFKLSPLHALDLSHLFVRISSLLGQFAFELEIQ
ncbi:hypothetical protein PsorP6_003862 [Peronosclerospora sorghi]|uniref:Uncharacterized protein n=1 Tax=Peronosclerospora sorghi TaxID=230839 RepID=A0ACC0VR19_9STRA|nr:hypothetical protein PsorP6_003862 [Peronosclerospora sorghi]